ncbi:50S ribosomal protein L24 [Pigmentiphaga aceris]|uniref:Large ribosomal subunit protein uL24 n=1 Tax=Pigmentiphaga aceris TaxID=1940612 RepID=A0A5C0B4A9_9BURK|nr:50S ribosomal protein L24 [Pigmentiphaga aceris]QEI08774.1 50S ribosomal protein L24 [Pigmentiphaga aceris]
MPSKIIKGDEVIVLTGRDKTKRGVVLARVDADHVLVEGINVVKKHQKPNPAKNETGGIVEKTLPIHISNVAVFNKVTGKADRVGFKLVDGKNVRVFRSNGEAVGSKA